MCQTAAVPTDPRRSPCHFAPVINGPAGGAVVWCSVCSASFHADAPELQIVSLLAIAANGTLPRTPADFRIDQGLPRPRLRLVHNAPRGDRRTP